MDKYPELQEYAGDDEVSGDFLSREKDLLGENNDFSGMEPHADNDIDQFEQQYPELEQEQSASEPAATNGREASAAPSVATSDAEPTSQFIEEWKVKHQLEIERRDKASDEKQQEIRKKAQVAIDDFYSNYNAKKDESVAKVHQEAEKFIAKRDEQNSGSTWDKVHSLIGDMGKPAEGITPIDKSRFLELVQSLKGDPDAPGAAGY